MDPILTLITKRACPFAERTRIVLNHKELAVEIREIDIHDKPDWFAGLSPLGKVPVLVHDGVPVAESTVINEYLEECFPRRPLVPRDPARRARMRFWIQFDETRLVPAFYRLAMEQDPARREARRTDYLEALRLFTRHALAAAHPFLFGAEPSLADITAFTHLKLLPVLHRNRGVPLPASGEPLERWLAAMSGHGAVRAAGSTAMETETDLQPYLDGTADGETARDMNGRERTGPPEPGRTPSLSIAYDRRRPS